MSTAKNIKTILNKGSIFSLLLILIVGFTYSVCAKSLIHNSIDDFVGEWNYSVDTYDMNITINTLPSGAHVAYYSIAAQSGERLDTGEKDDPNIEIIRFNSRTNLLELKLNSSYSTAQYYATLKILASNRVEFNLGDRIATGIHFYPRKPLILTKP